jgi:hypothetical protein
VSTLRDCRGCGRAFLKGKRVLFPLTADKHQGGDFLAGKVEALESVIEVLERSERKRAQGYAGERLTNGGAS